MSIVITNFNYARFLGGAIESALAQAYRPLEVIVVDDGSSDDSRDVIERFGGKVIAILKANGGQGSALNAGFGAATGDIVCFLDADDIFSDEKVAMVVESFQEHPTAGWYFHALEVTDEAGGFLRVAPPVIGDGLVDWRPDLAVGRLRAAAPATSGLCFRRSLLSEILPMPELPGILLSDNYIKLVAISAAEGMLSSQCLAKQRLHPANAYTGVSGRIKGELALNTAYWLYRRGPHLLRISAQMLAVGIGRLVSEDTLSARESAMVKEVLQALPLHERLRVVARSQGHALRNVICRQVAAPKAMWQLFKAAGLWSYAV